MKRRTTVGLLLALLALPACSAKAPPSPASAVKTPVRYFVGGDARDDMAHVLPWAFREARSRGVGAVIFLGDMAHDASGEDRFEAELPALASIPFYPVLGNHETARPKNGVSVSRDETVRVLGLYRARFLGTPRTPVTSAFEDRIVYSVDLPGDVHLVALDNVSQRGFGADQLAWLGADLGRARGDGRTKHILVGMHKALAGSGVTTHAMDEDGPGAIEDSAAALALFEQRGVEIVFASHFHGFVQYAVHGIRCFITGGLGAPLDTAHGTEGAFHHFLEVGVPPEGPLTVEVVRFPGAPSVAKEHEE